MQDRFNPLPLTPQADVEADVQTIWPLPPARPPRPGLRFLLSHPAHAIGLGFGSGLTGLAPGTFGTLWGWLAFHVLSRWLGDSGWAWVIGVSVPLGWWITPASFGLQLAAFGLFRFFDAVKPQPVRWADQLFHAVRPGIDRFAWRKAGFGIMLDDFVAAACTLLLLALWRFYQ